VIDTLQTEDLLSNVRRVSAMIRERCVVGPVKSCQGQGFLLGLRTEVPAAEIQARLLEQDILAGTSADPHVLRLLPPFTLAEEHVELLASALRSMAS